MPTCNFCNKKKMVLIKCLCGNSYCMKHNLPQNHNCIHRSESETSQILSREPTGEFKKIDKI